MEHTKGEWVWKNGKLIAKNNPTVHRDVVVAENLVGHGIYVDNDDDARLIEAAPETARQRDELLKALKQITETILKLSDNADSERMVVQEAIDYDFGYAEGKSNGLQQAESQIGKIINEAKAAIAKAAK